MEETKISIVEVTAGVAAMTVKKNPTPQYLLKEYWSVL